MRAFIVCGPQSSGNRFVASLLLASGCSGDITTNERLSGLGCENFVLIRHDNLEHWCRVLRDKGYSKIIGIVCIRHSYACAASMHSKEKHQKALDVDTVKKAYLHRNKTIQRNILDLTAGADWIDFLPVESLTTESIPHWLNTLGISPSRIDANFAIEYWEPGEGKTRQKAKDIRELNRKYFD